MRLLSDSKILVASDALESENRFAVASRRSSYIFHSPLLAKMSVRGTICLWKRFSQEFCVVRVNVWEPFPNISIKQRIVLKK